jgi:hypothetical protein
MRFPVSSLTPIGAVGRGLASAAFATGVMTAAQVAYYKATGSESSSTPGEVGKRIVEGVLQRESPPPESPLLNHGMHWLYGVGWGLPFGLIAGSRRSGSVIREGLALALGVWGASRTEMAAMQIAPPPWQDPPKTLATDLGFHAVYGLAAACAFRALR